MWVVTQLKIWLDQVLTHFPESKLGLNRLFEARGLLLLTVASP